MLQEQSTSWTWSRINNFRYLYRLSCINSLFYSCWTIALFLSNTESSKSSRKHHFILFFSADAIWLVPRGADLKVESKVFKIPANCFLFRELKKVFEFVDMAQNLSSGFWRHILENMSSFLFGRMFCLNPNHLQSNLFLYLR